MRTFHAILPDGRYRPTLVRSRSLKTLRQWLSDNPRAYYVSVKELDALRREWARTGGQPHVVIEI